MSYIGPNAIEIEPVETENIGSLAALVMPELRQCDDFIVRQQLGYALREFCRETNACVVEQPVKFEAHPHEWGYSAPMPAAPQGMVVGSVIDVSECGYPRNFEIRHNPDRIHISDFYGSSRSQVRFSVYPKAGGEDCPKWFKERYAEAIVAGAMHHLLSMSGRPWSDPQRASEYGAKYVDAVAEAAYRSTGAAAQGGPESAIPCGGLFM